MSLIFSKTDKDRFIELYKNEKIILYRNVAYSTVHGDTLELLMYLKGAYINQAIKTWTTATNRELINVKILALLCFLQEHDIGTIIHHTDHIEVITWGI